MTDPQQLVDDALATPATSTMPNLPPAPAAPAEPVMEPTVPPIASIPPMPPTPEPPTPPIAPVPPVTPTPTVAMGDETPLAFVAPAPSSSPTSSLPPVEASPLPPVAPMKPKKAGSKILMTILGIFALLGVLGAGGYYAYTTLLPQAQVAEVSQANCGKVCISDHQTTWNENKGKCVETKTPCSGTGPQKPPTPGNKTDCEKAKDIWCESTDANGKHYAFCNDTANQGCNALAVQKGYTVSSGAKVVSCSGTHASQCNCTGSTTPVCFDTGNNTQCGTLDGSDQNGLCAVYKNTNAQKFMLPGPDGIFGTADDVPAATQPTAIYFCKNVGSTNGVPNSCDTSTGGTLIDKVPACFCGTIQVDIPGEGYKSYTSQCGCTKASAPPGSPALSCSSLTKNVADSAITVNSDITLTCKGAIAPATAGTITYDFRYSVGTGAWVNLANKTATTAVLTPTQCGVEYTAECRACATIGGVKQCDPVWTGASTP